MTFGYWAALVAAVTVGVFLGMIALRLLPPS